MLLSVPCYGFKQNKINKCNKMKHDLGVVSISSGLEKLKD